jgi:hypothetical protein
MAPWKFDVTLLDLTGYSSNGAEIRLADNNRLIARVSSESESGLYDDHFVEDMKVTLLESCDGGISWEETSDAFPPEGIPTPDGGRVYIGGHGLQGEPLREHLEREGLGHLYRPEGMMNYRLYKAEKRAELEAEGWQVHDAFEDIVAIYPGIQAWRSEDEGETWVSSTIENAPRGDFPQAAHMVGAGGGLALADGTILQGVYGRLNRTDRTTRVWMARSTESGGTWTFTPLFFDPDDEVGFNETNLLAMSSGRILAMARPQFAKDEGQTMWQSNSDDGGLTWSDPEQVPFWGYPANLINLSNGDILATYAHRRYPVGVRACISHDEGRTWDVENEKIVRDDSLPKGVGYPQTVQLADGSLFTVYALSKIAALKQEDRVEYAQKLVMHPWFHTYAAGSRYSFDYVRARGQQRIHPEGVCPRRLGQGSDAIADSPQR